MHKYNNQDHSMYTAMLSVENIFGAHHDVWTVNVEEEYHEEHEGESSPDLNATTRARDGPRGPPAPSVAPGFEAPDYLPARR